MDLLTIWGVTSAVGMVFKPILEDLAKEATQDWIKDFFKGSLANVTRRDPLNKVAGQAIKAFCDLVQDELEELGLEEEQIKGYLPSLKKLCKSQTGQEVLGSPFREEWDLQDLLAVWRQLRLDPVPTGFDWLGVERRYQRRITKIRQGTPELQRILDSEVLVEIAAGLKRLQELPAGFDLRRYQRCLKDRHGPLKLESLDTSAYGYRGLSVWRMFIPQLVRECREYMPQTYEIPKEIQIQMMERGELEVELDPEEIKRRKRAYGEQPPISVQELIRERDRYPYLMILGDPGSGKSMLLQYLALQWAELPIKLLAEEPIPLLIELRLYGRELGTGRCQSVLEFVERSPSWVCHLDRHELDKWLQRGQGVILFDGLDEIFDQGLRGMVLSQIHDFIRSYPQVRVWVTSRVIGYKAQRLQELGFQHLMLQDLELEQIREFADRWHGSVYGDPEDRELKQGRLLRAIEESRAIRELAGNPLLLTMMAILNRNQELPRDRVDLYMQASRVLLGEWDLERQLRDQDFEPKTFNYRDKQQILQRIGAFMQENGQGLAGNVIAGADLERILVECLQGRDVGDRVRAARVLVEQLRVRNFILCCLGEDYYAFVHRTFLEFFCAWAIVSRFERDRSLTAEDLWPYYEQHWQDEVWHEVLRLVAGMIADRIDPKFVGAIVDRLMDLEVNRRAYLEGDEVYSVYRDVYSLRVKRDSLDHLLLASGCVSEIKDRHAIYISEKKLLKILKRESKDQSGWQLGSDAAISLMRSIALTWDRSVASRHNTLQFEAYSSAEASILFENQPL